MGAPVRIVGELALAPRPAKPAKWVAEVLGCDLSRVYKLLEDGLLEGYRDGRAVRVFVDSVTAYQNRDPICSGGSAGQRPAGKRRAVPINAAHADAMARLRARGLL